MNAIVEEPSPEIASEEGYNSEHHGRPERCKVIWVRVYHMSVQRP